MYPSFHISIRDKIDWLCRFFLNSCLALSRFPMLRKSGLLESWSVLWTATNGVLSGMRNLRFLYFIKEVSTWRKENLWHSWETSPDFSWTASCWVCPVITSCCSELADWRRLKAADLKLGPSVAPKGYVPTRYNTSEQQKEWRWYDIATLVLESYLRVLMVPFTRSGAKIYYEKKKFNIQRPWKVLSVTSNLMKYSNWGYHLKTQHEMRGSPECKLQLWRRFQNSDTWR